MRLACGTWRRRALAPRPEGRPAPVVEEATPMSNVKEDRHVEHDWWQEPIPPNVEFGEGFYCESAQIFRKLRSKRPRAVVIGKHVSCYAGCSFAIGNDGQCTIGDFTLLNGALIMAEEKIEIGSVSYTHLRAHETPEHL